VVRWPKGEPLSGRSCCDSCGTAIAAHDLIPLASYLINRGACRGCGAEIDTRHAAIETLCATAGAAALIASPDLAGLAGLVFGCLLIAIAALDFGHFWLPDRLTGALALAGLGAGTAGLEPPLVDRAIGLVTGFAVLWAIGTLYRLIRKREGLGGGDPKLLGAIGAWLGWQALPLVIVGASMMGIAWSIWFAARGQKLLATDKIALGGLMAAAAFPLWLGQVWLAH
jgi:leader peptidase (prepilin peptidase) / N-methyltransferase